MQNTRKNDKNNILHDALKLDIYRLSHVYSSRMFIRLHSSQSRALPKKGVLIRVIAFFKRMLDQLRFFASKSEQSIPQNAFLFFAESSNQLYSLKPVAECLGNSYLIGKEGDFPFQRTKLKGYLYSLPFFFRIFRYFLQSTGMQREAFRYNFDRYWFTYGFYIAARKWFRSKQPIALSMANDHVTENRVLLQAAQDEGIPVIYLQHASVTDEMPALTFDYAFLEGWDALDTYSKNGSSNTKVFLIGSPKFDQYYRFVNQHEIVSTLGICTNMLDPLEPTVQFIRGIHNALSNTKVILRPHPSERNKQIWKALCEELGFIYSDPVEEKVFAFLKKSGLCDRGKFQCSTGSCVVKCCSPLL